MRPISLLKVQPYLGSNSLFGVLFGTLEYLAKAALSQAFNKLIVAGEHAIRSEVAAAVGPER